MMQMHRRVLASSEASTAMTGPCACPGSRRQRQRQDPGEANDEFTFDHDETLRAYDLALAGMVSSDHNVFYGDLVVRRLHGESMDDDVPMQARSNADVDISWVGHVIDLCHDGHVHVRWGNHNKSKVYPRLLPCMCFLSLYIQ